MSELQSDVEQYSKIMRTYNFACGLNDSLSKNGRGRFRIFIKENELKGVFSAIVEMIQHRQ